MTSSNPSHALLSRNPRSPAHPQLNPQTSLYAPMPTPGSHLFSYQSPAGPSSTPPAPSTHHESLHTRSGSTPAFDSISTFTGRASHWGGRGWDEEGGERLQDGEQEEEEEDDLVVHPTFWRDAALPGRVKVIVGRHEFWCHKEVLWFSSPFFNAILAGSWAETEVDPSPTESKRASLRLVTHSSSLDGRPDSMRGVPEGFDAAATELIQGLSKSKEGQERDEGEEKDRQEDGVGESVDEGKLETVVPAKAPSRDQDHLAVPEDEGVETGEAKTSVYLDAMDDPHVEDIMRELRDLPEPSGRALETLVEGSTLGHETAGGRPPEPVAGPGGMESSISTPFESPVSMEETGTAKEVEISEKQSKKVEEDKAREKDDTDERSRREVARAKRASASSLNLARRRTHSAGRERKRHERHDAVVELREESPAAFQDFLFWAYPHLECKVTWTNVASLLALSSKLIVPALQTLCERFLLTHASGRPIEALALAEQHGNGELYREASRFVLDQATWDADEFECLSKQTQIKLSKRRTWFLERLLKLGTIDVKKEYTCRPDCPDPSRCQAQLDEKWRQANNAVSRYGPPQPSVAFRCLRQLEWFPNNPTLVMQHPVCQNTAKSWIASLFDRMFQPKMAFGALSPGTEKYWLYITIN